MRLSDPKREAFAQHRAIGKSQSEAARLADYATGNPGNTGMRLSREPQVAARVQELRQGSTEPAASDPASVHTSKLSVVTNIVSIHRLAKASKEYAIALQCQRTLAQIGGLLGDGTGTRVSNTVNITGMTPAEMNLALRQSLGSLPIADRKQIAGEEPAIGEVIDVEALECESTAINQSDLAVERET